MHTIEEMQKLEKEHKERIDNWTAQYVAKQAEAQATADKLVAEKFAEVRALEAQRISLTKTVEDLTRDRVLAQASVNTIRQEGEDLKAMHATFVAGMEHDVELRKATLAQLQASEKDLVERIAAAQKRYDVLLAETRDAEKKFDERLVKAQAALDSIRELVKTESDRLTAAEAANANLVAVTAEVEKALAEKKAALERVVAERREHEDAVARFQAEVKDLFSQSQTLKAELAANTAQFADITAAKRDLEAKIVDQRFLQSQLDRKLKDLADREQKINALNLGK